MKMIGLFNQENVTDDDAKQFRHRKAVRGIVFDSDENIALIHAKSAGYYSLPGGGVKDNETLEEGIIRECKEETGCDVEIIEYIGTTLEYRKENRLLNESYGYTLKTVGEKGFPIFVGDESEAERKSVVIWVSVAEAIRLIESILPVSKPQSGIELYNSNCLERDLTFLETI